MHLTTADQHQTNNFARQWVFWLLFFFQFAAIGAYFTYLNVYYHNVGLSGTQIGMMNMTTALVSVSGSILWGYLSDRSGQTRLMIAIGALGSLLIAQLIPLFHTFWAFLVLGVVGSFLNSAPGTLVDSTVISTLGDNRESYGRYRVAGSIGYILTTLSSGYLFDAVGLHLMFPVYGIIMASFAGAALLLPKITIRREAKGTGRTDGIRNLLRLPTWILFMVCVFLAWISSNASIMFLGVSLSALGAKQSLIGMAVTIGAIAELPFMAFGGYFMRRYGERQLILLALLLMTMRYFLLGSMKAPESAIAINLLNGPAFAFFWTSAVTYANRMAPSGYAGTAQGMLNSTMSFAGVISSLLTGWLFDSMGATRLFLVMSILCLCAFLLFGFGRYLFIAKEKQQTY